VSRADRKIRRHRRPDLGRSRLPRWPCFASSTARRTVSTLLPLQPYGDCPRFDPCRSACGRPAV